MQYTVKIGTAPFPTAEGHVPQLIFQRGLPPPHLLSLIVYEQICHRYVPLVIHNNIYVTGPWITSRPLISSLVHSHSLFRLRPMPLPPRACQCPLNGRAHALPPQEYCKDRIKRKFAISRKYEDLLSVTILHSLTQLFIKQGCCYCLNTFNRKCIFFFFFGGDTKYHSFVQPLCSL